ncbi:LLM class F420-dependent oxidoreductase [Aquamicrobium sp. LC103]|uniref:LLM class F420-dependent oxidoreductase n=1 Tax=Aquamicrobium sp. LC103 TaxID=1120658 RepID=UPI00063EBD27|nr:LLM class F420-dependent oxidoreductase [Aquamicrobium sp. LC103]TKT78215.1 LLM class F420-dependent oxidoreductase [Aquamicrobium sp. LC103]
MPKIPIRIAVQLQPIHAEYSAIRKAVAQAEALGADILFNSDHFFPSVGDDSGACLEAWTMLGAWAEQTSRIALGVSVSGNNYRNANLLADMARTVDHLSGGRAILGIGSGWFLKDHTEYGFAFPPAEERLIKLRETLETIDRRLPRLNPPPLQSRLPVMIGNGGDRKPPDMVARHADIWMDFKPVPEVAGYNAELDLECRRAGRAPESIERGVAVAPADLNRVEEFLDAGCTLFMIRYAGPEFDLRGVSDWVEWRDETNKEFPAPHSRQPAPASG